MNDTKLSRNIILSVIVASLGYFVDIYDLLLFSIVRIKSLKSLGIEDPQQLKEIGLALLSWQMWGMLIGGIIWGVYGDKKGRLSVLFGSIIVYSIANIANGMVHDVTTYKILRFVAGFGLAGELGAGITLVSELMTKEKRGYGTTIIASIGILGAVLAYFVSKTWDWRIAYYVGGALGLSLLVLRISLFESGMFSELGKKEVSKGNFIKLITNSQLLPKYIGCILVGFPTWFVVGILVTLSPEFGKYLHISEPVEVGKSVMWCYIGLSLGDLASGMISQFLKSRKKALLIFHLLSAITILLFLNSYGNTLNLFYTKITFLGFGVGYWAVFVANASEQFGTNIRATVATTVPNFARGSLPLITFLFSYFEKSNGLVNASYFLAAITITIALIAWFFMAETFGKNLDYVEDI